MINFLEFWYKGFCGKSVTIHKGQGKDTKMNFD